MINYLLYAWVCSKGSWWNFCQESIVREIPKGLYGKDAVISHIIYDLGNTENNTDKSPNIIEDYDTTKKFLLQSIFSSGRKL